MNDNKIPFTINNTNCKPDTEEDFVNLEDLIKCKDIDKYRGIGISVNFSHLTAIDIDHCFLKNFDIKSISTKGLNILKMFKDTYCEFSFSGTGLRILLNCEIPIDYNKNYYIKNSKENIEFYNYSFSYRYVTLTGRFIYNNPIKTYSKDYMIGFFDKYMKKTKLDLDIKGHHVNKSIDELETDIKKHLFKDNFFLNLWYNKAPGSGKNESELDYQLLLYLYKNITDNIEQVKELFMKSPYFKSKDKKHYEKFIKNNYGYFYYTVKNFNKN